MSNSVITSSDIQVRYEQLYAFLMNFLWEFSTVQALANLEIAIFKRFPDKSEMLKCLNTLKQSIIYTANELAEDDETEFKDALDNLEDAINDYDNAGYELYSVEIFIDNPDDIMSSDDIDISDNGKSKRKFNIGDIEHMTKEERELQDEAARTLNNPFEEMEE